MPAFPTEALTAVYELLVDAARKGARCPQSEEIKNFCLTRALPYASKASAITTELARTGKIRITIYGRNWRVVEILQGPHRGARTQPDPKNGFLKLTIPSEAWRLGIRARPTKAQAATAATTPPDFKRST